MKLTLRMLTDRYACTPEVLRTQVVFPEFTSDGIEINQENLQNAYQHNLDLPWLYLNVLTPNYSSEDISKRLDEIGVPDQVNDCACNSCRMSHMYPHTLFNLILAECALIDDKPVMPVSEGTPSGL